MQPYFYITLICFITASVIIFNGLLKCYVPSYTDPLTIRLASTPFDLFQDGWAISHFVFFAVIGYLYPSTQYILFAWILGVLWEISEYFVKDTSIFPSACVSRLVTHSGGRWWYGRWQDIVMNTLGLIVGVMIAHTHK